MAVSDYNTNPDLNTAISGINIAEGCPPSGINNAIRQLMADVKAAIPEQADLIKAMTGATASAAGSAGLVPAPAAGRQGKPLRGDGTWADSLNCSITGNAATATTATSASTASSLATARTIRTNLASTATASFNGTANIAPGVTGTLPVANGGTGATSAAAARTALGITLSDSVTSTSSTTFASSKAVKSAYDRGLLSTVQKCTETSKNTVTAPSGGTWFCYGYITWNNYNTQDWFCGPYAGGSVIQNKALSDSIKNVFILAIRIS